MPPIEFVVALLVVTIPLLAIARRFDIPYPVAAHRRAARVGLRATIAAY